MTTVSATRCRILATAAAVLAAGVLTPATASADLVSCDDPACTPGITGGVVLGSYCGDTSYYVFGTTSWGRLVFCGSPRRYEPRYFRSPSMAGVKNLNDACVGRENQVAQAPDGLFLSCIVTNGEPRCVRGDA